MQSSLLQIRIVQLAPASFGSADLKYIGFADDGFEYALKRLTDNPLLPITEWTGYHLSRSIGLFTPDFAPVWLDDDTPAFGSRWETAQQLGVPPDPIEVARYFGPDMKHGIEPIFAVDAFLPNDDRHARNFLWRTTTTGPTPLAFDFSRAWLLSGLPFGLFPLAPTTNTLGMWKYLKGHFGYAAPADAFQKIAALPNDWIEQVLYAAPHQWVATFDPQPTIDFWVHQRQKRCADAMSLL